MGNNKKIELSVSSDYATIEIGEIVFYYGYEVTEEEVWCFIAKKKDKVLFVINRMDIFKNSNLKKDSSPEMFLLVGIGLYYEKMSTL